MSRIVVKNLPKQITEAKLKEHFSKTGAVTDVQMLYTKEKKFRQFCFVGYKTEEEAKAAIAYFDKTYIYSSRVKVEPCYALNDPSKPKPWSKHATDKKDVSNRWKKQEESLQSEETIGESGRLFLRNLTYTATEDDVQKAFEKYGPLTEVNIPVDKVTRKQKGIGTVTFLFPEHAVKAHSELDGSIFQGRMLHILPGKEKTSLNEILDQDGLTYKQKREAKEKLNANSTHNWNTLFIGQNAVVDAIAKTYNTTKEKVLEDGVGGSSLAVRLALGETQIVQDTQKFLEDNGVRLTAFNQEPTMRSKTILLVKNLPAGTKQKELIDLFAKHGELGRVILPPAGVTALVEFIEPYEARKAFTKLAYHKFKHLPLYLEWAPDDSFTSTYKSKNSKENMTSNTESAETEANEKSNKDKESEEEEEEEDEPEPDTTLFVKNLNFSTTEDQLKTHFGRCGLLHYVMIATKKDPNNPGRKLSMGYGFVRYKYKMDLERALKQLQNSELDGKSLELKRSDRTLQSDVKSTRKATKITPQNGPKLLVRNVPFEAKVQELTELFKPFGELKAVRLPKKLVGDVKHRGFAFVEYFTKKDAKRAFKALSQSTHLYGRRLVLEWARTEEDIDDVRKRTIKHFHEEPANKTSKKSTLDPESIGLQAE